MRQNETRRYSHCVICGKRLSEKTESGAIRWQAGHVDDAGLFCENCYTRYTQKKSTKGKKNART